MAKCLDCVHWKPCYSGKEWDAAVGTPCEYFADDMRPVVKGEWSVSKDDYLNLYTICCSVCHEEWCFEEEGDIVAMFYNYCPKCGNPMLEVKKEVQDEAD